MSRSHVGLAGVGVLAIVVASACSERTSGQVVVEHHQLSGEPPVDFHSLVEEEGGVLLDVRTRREFEHKHIDGALNIPVEELGRRLPELGGRERPIVIYCRSGNRSSHALRLLRERGFSTVHDIGPMGAWGKKSVVRKPARIVCADPDECATGPTGSRSN